jgi:protein SCO1/2
MKLGRSTLWFVLLLGVLLASLAGYEFLVPKKLHGEVIEPPKLMPDFTLQSAGGPVSLSDFRDKVVILYFGYTSCPDLCPTTLAILHQAVDALGDNAKDVQVIFISVDWQRDTPKILEKYTAHFNEDFLGLTGTQAQIDSFTSEFGIFYLLNLPDENGFYSVDHTASIRVLDRQGRLAVIWPYDTQPAEITSDLQVLLKNSTNTP